MVSLLVPAPPLRICPAMVPGYYALHVPEFYYQLASYYSSVSGHHRPGSLG